MGKKSIALIVILTVVGISIAVRFSEPPPPTTVRIATGSTSGAYYRFAERIRESLEGSGLEVEVVVTAGSVENAELVNSGDDAVIGFLQGGAVSGQDFPRLRGIASLYYEPIWVFYRSDLLQSPEVGETDEEPESTLNDLVNLRGSRIAVGPAGSGTLAAAQELFKRLGFSMDQKAVDEPTEFLRLSTSEAAAKLQSQEIDAAIFVSGVESPLVSELLGNPELKLLSFARHVAYTNELRFLTSLSVPAGLIDLAKNIPDQDTVVLAPTANLVGNTKTHPALVERVLAAATVVCRSQTKLEKPDEFPSISGLSGLPIDETAERVISSGPSWMPQVFPYWMLNLIRRLKLFAISFVPALLFVTKGIPFLLDFKESRKVYKIYQTLFRLEHSDVDRNRKVVLEELKALRQKVAKMKTSIRYQKEVYNLRMHIQLVESDIESSLEEVGADGIAQNS